MDSDVYNGAESKSEKEIPLIWEYTEISTPLERVVCYGENRRRFVEDYLLCLSVSIISPSLRK
jgi:hypothetical protein